MDMDDPFFRYAGLSPRGAGCELSGLKQGRGRPNHYGKDITESTIVKHFAVKSESP
jgi:hypothetical protein